MDKKKYCNIGCGLVRLDFTRVKPNNIKERNIENRRFKFTCSSVIVKVTKMGKPTRLEKLNEVADCQQKIIHKKLHASDIRCMYI